MPESLKPAEVSRLQRRVAKRGGAVVFLDCRADRFYKAKHPAGAVNLDLDGIRFKGYALAESGQTVVVVGAGDDDGRRAAYALETIGIPDSRYVAGGFAAWEAAGLPTEQGAGPEVKGYVGFKLAPAYGADPRGEWKNAPP